MQEVKINNEDDASIKVDKRRLYRSSLNSHQLANSAAISSWENLDPVLNKKSIYRVGGERRQHGQHEKSLKSNPDNSKTPLAATRGEKSLNLDDVEARIKDREDTRLEREHQRNVMERMRFITCVICIGGFLSGYSVGAIPGALLPVRNVFALSRRQCDMMVSCMIFAAFVSSFVGGVVNRYFGRRKAIMLAAVSCALGSIVLFTAESSSAIFYGEMLIGTAIGIESMTTPLYIAEVVKPDAKVSTISMYTLTIMIGQVTAGIISGIMGPRSNNGWRYIFGFAFIPSILLLIGFYNLPESPSWLMTKNERQRAQSIYQGIRDFEHEVRNEMADFEHSLTNTGGGYDFIEKPLIRQVIDMCNHAPTMRAIIVGCGLMLIQQLCGINAVIYFAAPIYEMVGFTKATSIWLSCVTLMSQIIGQFINIKLVEKVRRRKLVLSSLILVAFSSAGLGISFYIADKNSAPVDISSSMRECSYQPNTWLFWVNGVTKNCFDCVQIEGCGYCDGACVAGSSLYGPDSSWMCPRSSSASNSNSSFHYYSCDNPDKWLAVSFLNLFVFVFGLGMASVPWIVNTELFPPQYCSLAVGFSTATNWMGNLIISSSFLEISDSSKLTTYGTFSLYSIISFLGAIWIYFVLPETMDSTFIESEDFFARCGKNDNNGNENTKLLNNNECHNSKVKFAAYDTIEYQLQ